METRSLKFVAEACAGRVRPGPADVAVRRVCTDSRQAQPGDLFVALTGERFDGHHFLPDVARRGVAAIMVEEGKAPPGEMNCWVVIVDDTRQALGRLAARYRLDFAIVAVAVGGSNGKTTTKELLASVLSQGFCTVASADSYNNDVGVPLSLLQLEQRHQAAVFEVGTNHPGELAPLIRMIRPDVGVITGVGREHLEFFRDLAGVADEEGWLAEMLPANGKLVINGDTPEIERIRERSRAMVISVGWGPGNDWRAGQARVEESGVGFRVWAPRAFFSGEYRVNLIGRHQVTNALLALAVGAEFGLEPDQIRRGLLECPAPKMRMQISKSGGICLLDDSYNANPDSMRAALETLRDLPCQGRRIAVLGDMAELGMAAEAAHREVGRFAAEVGVDHLFAVGRLSGLAAEAARQSGLDRIETTEDVECAARSVKALAGVGDLILVKASRSSRLERVSEALRGTTDERVN